MFIASQLRLDPVVVVTEVNKSHRAVRLAAATVLRQEQDKANKKN